MSLGLIVAKKRGPKPKAGRKPKVLVTFKCSPEYKEWLVALARSQRDIPSRVIDLALVDFAKKLGAEPPPER